MLYGGGWAEMRMARAIEEAAKKTPGGCAAVSAVKINIFSQPANTAASIYYAAVTGT